MWDNVIKFDTLINAIGRKEFESGNYLVPCCLTTGSEQAGLGGIASGTQIRTAPFES